MSRLFASALRACLGAAFLFVGGGLVPADAGLPKGVVISADEQIADEAAGITIARGRAELTVGKYAIRGRAETIEVRPAINEILLKGEAHVSVGARTYASDTLSCTLDFARCVSVDKDQPLPASAFGTEADTLPR